LGIGGGWFLADRIGKPLEGSNIEDIHFQLSKEGTGSHLRANQGYGVVLDCEGWIKSPPSPSGKYSIKILVDDAVAFQGKINANQKIQYKMKTRFGTAMTIFAHEIQGLSGQKEVPVTYYFKYSYSYASILDRLLSFDF
jgi:hypothetical protein